MISKILTKLIDKAIIPAVLLLTARVVSVILISRYLGFDFTVGFSGIIFTNTIEYVFVNSYSTIVMITVLVFGLAYVLVKSYAFHETHIKPATTAKLFDLKLPSLIQPSFDLYSQAAVWISYAYLLLIISGIMLYNKLIYPWVFYTALLLTIVTTIFFVFDIEQEVKFEKKKDYDLDQDTEFIEMEKND